MRAKPFVISGKSLYELRRMRNAKFSQLNYLKRIANGQVVSLFWKNPARIKENIIRLQAEIDVLDMKVKSIRGKKFYLHKKTYPDFKNDYQ